MAADKMTLPHTIYLPALPWESNQLQPFISSDVIEEHYTGHHAVYVNNYNSGDRNLFNYNGHLLHTLYWNSLSPNQAPPEGRLKTLLRSTLGVDFLNEVHARLLKVAGNIQGSGWLVLAIDPKNFQLKIRSIRNHDLQEIGNLAPLLVIDMWEHAYYLQYKHLRMQYLSNILNLLNWSAASARLEQL